jgi:hypothetical protein
MLVDVVDLAYAISHSKLPAAFLSNLWNDLPAVECETPCQVCWEVDFRSEHAIVGRAPSRRCSWGLFLFSSSSSGLESTHAVIWAPHLPVVAKEGHIDAARSFLRHVSLQRLE